MLKKFKKKPTQVLFYVTISGKWEPEIFQPYWLVKQNLIGEDEAESISKNSLLVHNQITSLKFQYCKIHVNEQQIIFQTDQVGFLPQTFDLINGILTSLKSMPASTAEFTIYTHYKLVEFDNSSKFLASIAHNTFWSEILGEYDYSKITVTQKGQKTFPSDITISTSSCPNSKKLLHIYIDEKFNTEEKHSNVRDIQKILDKEMFNSFNSSVNLINNIANGI